MTQRRRPTPLLLSSMRLLVFMRMGLLLVCLPETEGGSCVHPVNGPVLLMDASEADCDNEDCLTLCPSETERFSYSVEPGSLELTPSESDQQAAALAQQSCCSDCVTCYETEHVASSNDESGWPNLKNWALCFHLTIGVILLFYVAVAVFIVIYVTTSDVWNASESELLDSRLNLVLKMAMRDAERIRILMQVQSILKGVSKTRNDDFSYSLEYVDPLFNNLELDDALADCRKHRLDVAAAAAAMSANRVDLIQDIVPDLPRSFLAKWGWYMFSTRSKWPSLKQFLDVCKDNREKMRTVPYQVNMMVNSMNMRPLDDDSADLLEYLLSGSFCQPRFVQYVVECAVQQGLSRQLQVTLDTNGKADMREGVFAFDSRMAPVLTELVRHMCKQREAPLIYPQHADFTACLSLAVRNGLFTEPLPHKWWRHGYRILARDASPRGFGPRSDHETVSGTAMSAAALSRQADIITLLHRVGAATNKEMHALSQYYVSVLEKHLSSCLLKDCPERKAARDVSSLMSGLAGTPRSLSSLTAQVISVSLVGQGRTREDNVQRLPVPTRLKRQILFDDALDNFHLQRSKGSRAA